MNEILKRINEKVLAQGNQGAIDLAPILTDMALGSYPAVFGDALLALDGSVNITPTAMEAATDFPAADLQYIIENHLPINPYISGANLIIKASAFSIEDDTMYISYEHGGDKKKISIVLNADNTYNVTVEDVQ